MDAGKYKCTDRQGFRTSELHGHYAIAELIVTDGRINCSHNLNSDGVIPEDLCDQRVSADVLNFTCVLDFKGNSSIAMLKWKQYPGGSMYSKNSLSVNPIDYVTTKVTSSLVIPATQPMNGSYFICSVQADKAVFKRSPIEWISPPVKLKYMTYSVSHAVVCPPVELFCSVDTNLYCSYKWIHVSTQVVSKSNPFVILSSATDLHEYGNVLWIVQLKMKSFAMLNRILPLLIVQDILLHIRVVPDQLKLYYSRYLLHG